MGNAIRQWDEVENLERTVSGLVYKIEKNMVYFQDEFKTKFNLKKSEVVKCSFLSSDEKNEIKETILKNK